MSLITKNTPPYYEIEGNVKIYRALMAQSGTNPPTVTAILQNTIGDIEWTRMYAGGYEGTLTGAFAANKVFILAASNGFSDSVSIGGARGGNNTVELGAVDGTGTNVDIDSMFQIEILVFP